jgi:hypothetical protein
LSVSASVQKQPVSKQHPEQTMEELLGDIANQANNRNCFPGSDARVHGAVRHWGLNRL